MLGLHTEQRQRIANEVSVLMKRPRTAANKAQIDSLIRQDEELQGGVDREFEKRAMDAFGNGFLRGKTYDKNVLQSAGHIQHRDLGVAGLGTGAASAGGVLAPVGFNRSVDAAMKFATDLFEICDVVETPTGAAISYPADDDRNSTGFQVGEGQQTPMEDVANFSQVSLVPFKYSSGMIRVSWEMMQDSGIEIDSYAGSKFGIRLGRILGSVLTNGTGSGQPHGFVTQALAAGGTVAAVGTGGNPTKLQIADFAALEASLDVIYRANARFVMHPSTLQQLRATVNSVGAPIFPGLNDSVDDHIFGYPVSKNIFLQSIQPTASSPQVTTYPIAFGDFKRYRIRRVSPSVVYRFDERFADVMQTGFMQMMRVDGNLCDGNGGAIKLLSVTF